MSLDSIPQRLNGQTIDQTWYNILRQVLSQELAPRDVNATPGAAVGDLGDSTNYWKTIFVKSVVLAGGGAVSKAGFSFPGAILPFGGTTAPIGTLFCDGSAVSRTTYADLFTVIGENYGNGDGSTTFNLPDLRGQFIRGTDDMGTPAGAAGTDPNSGTRTAQTTGGNIGNLVGSEQPDDVEPHVHAQTVGNGGPGGIGFHASVASPLTAFTNNNAGAETRPINVYCNFIIQT